MTRYTGTDEFRGAEFVNLDMSGASFRDVILTGMRMRGVLLVGADLDGDVTGLRVNGVDVEPLVSAELDRRHPERARLRPTTVDGAREAWSVVESFWASTLERAGRLTEADRHRSVDGEWSFTQTLRHLVFVIDGWLGHAVWGEARPFHPLALPPSFIENGAEYGIDVTAAPSSAEVLAVRAERVARVRDFLAATDQEELDRVRPANTAPGYPPPAQRTALACFRVLLDEEWAHHQFAVRDLAAIEAVRPAPPR
jgi:hypothetical protein